ncbi:MAG: 4-alpha-glucanotransferase [Treponema sp.]|jgi:4-alpha-glucanotransferase|nr:4-alpha-glucanotransferase [Treponema sp.]
MAQQADTNKRLIGVVIPVGALRSKESLGIGEFPDLVEFAGLCKKMGAGLIQLLPVNDTGSESSPYFAISAFALHPVYIRIGDIEEAPALKDLKKRLVEMGEKFGKETRFPFEPIFRAKMKILRDIFTAAKNDIFKKAAQGGTLAEWIEKNSWVREYAVYRRLKDANEEKSYQEWRSHKNVNREIIEGLWKDEKLKEEHLFWVWIQEALDAQFSRAAAAIADMGIVLEGDLPILINEDSCDVWAHPEYFHLNLSAGAPPDMYGPEGQNWGFPTYNWEALEKNNYDWWRNRLKVAERYFRAYRIDHVLGFFRIWTSSRFDTSSALGRFVPYVPITKKELEELGFDKSRIRWVSYPHIPTGEVWDAVRNNWGGDHSEEDVAAETGKVFSAVLDRIGEEELWLFKDSIRGEKDIASLGLHPAAQGFLVQAWHNRLFLEYEKGHFFPTWFYRFSRAYASLSEEERNKLEVLFENHKSNSEKVWEREGKKLLMVLKDSSSMLPCAEDLGEIPDCVPVTLGKLKILGLRVVRWHRKWNLPGEPYIPFEDYPELSVCTPAVHDSSTVREWWEREADQEIFSGFLGFPSLPRVYNPGTAKLVLSKIAAAASRFRVFQIQDLLHLSARWYAEDAASERINVPGTYNQFNWTYRLPASIEEIGNDSDFINAVQELAKIKPIGEPHAH